MIDGPCSGEVREYSNNIGAHLISMGMGVAIGKDAAPAPFAVEVRPEILAGITLAETLEPIVERALAEKAKRRRSRLKKEG